MDIEEYKKSQLNNLEHALSDDDYSKEDCLSFLDNFKNCGINQGYDLRRLEYDKDHLENSFHKKWLEINLPISGLNNGEGILQDLMTHHGIRVNQRERKIVASIIQWLGSNCGYCFLAEVLKDNNKKIVEINNE